MEKDIKNQKQLWSEPQIIEIEVKTTAEQHGNGHAYGKTGIGLDGLGQEGGGGGS